MQTTLWAEPFTHPGFHGGPPWFVGPIILLLFATLIGVLIWRAVQCGRTRERSGTDRAKDFLADRYARGELTTDEYRERLHQLGGTS